MYVPPRFEELEKDKPFDLIETNPLGVMITHGENGLDAYHIPFELDRSQGEWGTLRCRVARKKPVWQDVETGDEVLVIFRSADAQSSQHSTLYLT